MKHLILFSAVLIAFCASCKDEKKNANKADSTTPLTETSPDQFRLLFSESQVVRPSNVEVLTRESLSKRISESEEFISVQTESNDPCESLYDSIKVQASDRVLKLEGTLNDLGCLKNSDPNSSISSASHSVLVFIYCSTGGLTVHNGKTYTKMYQDYDCSGDSESLSSSLTKITFTGMSDGKQSTVTSESRWIRSDGAGRPCRAAGRGNVKNYKYENCVDTTITTYSDPSLSVNFEKYTYHNIATAQPNVGNYYESGTMDFAFGNWEGTMTYRGASTPPTWSTRTPEVISNQTYSHVATGLVGLSANRMILPKIRL